MTAVGSHDAAPGFRVLIEEPTKARRWVAIAADWPGLERGARTEDEAVARLVRYLPRYLPVATRAGLGPEFSAEARAAATGVELVGRHPGTGSTDFWGISFAPSLLDHDPFDVATFDRQVRLLRAAWAEFDTTATAVSAELRLGPRGGGRPRDDIVRHVRAVEGGDFSARVGVPTDLDARSTAAEVAAHRDRFVGAMRAWFVEGRPLGKWTVPFLLRHTAYHVLDHAWEMQDRDLTSESAAG